MAITTFSYSAADIDNTTRGAHWSFEATKHDMNYLEDPAVAGKRVVSKAISLDIATEAVKVEFAEKEPGQTRGRQHTYPAGSIAAGVPFACNVVKVFSTGTGSNVKVQIHV